MYLLASDGSKLTIDNYQVLRDRTTGLILSVHIEKTKTTFDALETYFNNIIENSLSLEVYNDSEEKEQSLRGFSFELYIGANYANFDIRLKCDSENTYQIGILQDKAAKQDSALAEQRIMINEQGYTLNEHAEAISTQGSELATQKQTSVALTEQSTTQSDTLDVLISEVIPTAIDVAIEASVAMVMEQLQAMLTPPIEEEIPTDIPADGEVVEEPTTGDEPVEE